MTKAEKAELKRLRALEAKERCPHCGYCEEYYYPVWIYSTPWEVPSQGPRWTTGEPFYLGDTWTSSNVTLQAGNQ